MLKTYSSLFEQLHLSASMLGTGYFLVQSLHDHSDAPPCEILASIENLLHVTVVNFGNDIVTSLQGGFIQDDLLADVKRRIIKAIPCSPEKLHVGELL